MIVKTMRTTTMMQRQRGKSTATTMRKKEMPKTMPKRMPQIVATLATKRKRRRRRMMARTQANKKLPTTRRMKKMRSRTMKTCPL